MKKLMIAAAVVAATGALCAQEAGVVRPASKTNTATAEVKTPSSVVAAAAVAEDGGEAIVAQAEAKAAEVAAQPDDPNESALNKVNADLDTMGINHGYDSAKKAIVQVAQANMEIADPANDSEFMLKREQIGNYALLQAKADIIRAIYTEFSAVDRALTKYDDETNDNAEKFRAAKEAVELKRAELAEEIGKYNSADGQAVANVTLNDRFGTFVGEVINKIDQSYVSNALAVAKSADAAAATAAAVALKEKAKQLLAEYKVLEDAANLLPKEPVLEAESAASMLSRMPIFGATVLTQAESWDAETKQYAVAVAVVWSPKLQACALKVGTGDFSASGKPGTFSKLEWVKAQDWRSMIGTRRFTDNKGNNYFVGIGAVDPGLGVQANAKRMLAETLARKNVAMALIGDLATQREVTQNLKVYADQSTATKQRLVDSISAKVDLHLKGCMSLAKKEVFHPITGRRIYVCAYYIDPALAKEAGETMKKMFADAGLVAQHTNKQRGVVEGAARAYEDVKNDASARAAGQAEGALSVNSEIIRGKRAEVETSAKQKERERAARVRVKEEPNRRKSVRPAKPAVSKPGTHSGGTFDTNF